ncbi:MAG: biopolymer transporter ExbD, partial [Perlabentimonas sp.]
AKKNRCLLNIKTKILRNTNRGNSQTPAKAITTVSITQDLSFYVEQTPVLFSDLEPILAQKMQGQNEPTISLHVHRSVPMEEVVKVMNIAKNNRYKLVLATQPLK